MMPNRSIRSLSFFAALAAAHAAALPALMPMPAKVEPVEGRLAINSSFGATIDGYSDARLQAAVRRIESRIFREFGLAIIAPAAPAESKPVLTVECRAAGPQEPLLGEDESYQLDVAPGGARLRAATVTGALRGMETFVQLIAPGTDGFFAPAVHIEDHPRFPWRGLMLDVSRHWMPVAVIERNLNAMAAVKLNVLHWHLSDDQGFRVESLRYPRLQQAGSDGHFYTQQQVRQVVDYASARGIRVIPEFDIPGHTTSWFVGYPELASAPGPYAIERHWGIFKPTMDPSREETYRFLDTFLGEMAALFPDPYFHIGGDEVEDTQWRQSAAIQAFAREHHLAGSHGLQDYFNHRVQQILKAHGKTMIGWDEVLAPDLDTQTVIQSWRGPASLAEAARKGYRGILSFGYYLDHLKPAAAHYALDPLSGPAAQLDAAQTARILGGEACMWTEYSSSETVDSRIWPRLAAIAERFWSPRDITDPASMYARMETISRELEWVGVHHRGDYEPMLDRLAGGGPAEAVRTLADAVEALGIEGRRDTRTYTSLVDLNRLVDAARPESEPVRQLEIAAAKAGAGKASPDEIAHLRAAFHAWAENDARFQPLSRSNSLLSELQPLSRSLSALGTMGLQALDDLQSGKLPAQSWVAQQKRDLDTMAKPCAEVSLAAVRPVRVLVDAVSRQTSHTAPQAQEGH
jgi:hexosaminidase